jgi:hypothetical protein
VPRYWDPLETGRSPTGAEISSKDKSVKPAPPFTSARTVLGHGIYLAAVALVLFLAPGMVRPFIPFPAELDWWNRLLALPVFNLGVLCIAIAWAGSRLLIKITAATRLLVVALVTILLALQIAPPIAFGVGLIDLISAGLTIWALAAEAPKKAA